MTSESHKEDEKKRAILAVIEEGVAALSKERRQHADLGLFTDREVKHFENLARLMEQYLERSNPSRPLCLAVFGAPGSGKSRLVKAMPRVMRSGGEMLAKLAEINLTQVTSLDNLAAALDNARKDADGKVPFIFFDEFDAKRDEAAWGWLSWFLAPMQDGAFFHQGERRDLKRAIYVFAGGTSSSYEGFGKADPKAFVSAKGPDFVSRLRGYLNIPGVNAGDSEQPYRRAAVLHHQLKTHQKAVDDELRTALLHVGRYKHGARSVEAVIELMPRKVSALTVKDIGDHPLLKMHVDRGPLDASVIGGWIGLSGSDAQAAQLEYREIWRAIGRELISDGATLACGGRERHTGGLMEQLEDFIKEQPQRLDPTGEPWLIIAREKAKARDTRVQARPPPGATFDEFPLEPDAKKRDDLAKALEMFRMRHQLSLSSVARFAIAGRLERPAPTLYKRFPGVAEELMLALAMRRPIYVSAALGGAARWVGELLGLGRRWGGLPNGFDEEWLRIPPVYTALFRPPPFNELPLTREELIKFFQDHALDGPLWVKNGLTPEENRQLFELGVPEFKTYKELLAPGADESALKAARKSAAEAADKIAALVRRGLRAHFAPDTL